MSKVIEAVDYFSCGYCTNHLHWIFKNVPKKKLTFHAGVFLIKHKTEGYILYDTGYNTKLLKRNLKYKLYCLLNPVNITKETMIDYQLKKKGIESSEINYIILSHLHPDHIGGLEKFSNAAIIMTDTCWKNYQKNTLKSLIFKEFIPKNIEKRLMKIEIRDKNERFKYLDSYDLFSDDSILLSAMDGHSEGQCCIYIPEKDIFIGADASWGIDLLDYTNNMKLIPFLIQDNFVLYKNNSNILKDMLNDGVKVIVSHDNPNRIWRILNEKNE